MNWTSFKQERAVNELVKAWHDPKATIFVPVDCTLGKEGLDKMGKDDVKVVDYTTKKNNEGNKVISETCILTVFDMFKFAVTLNQHGYFVQQLQYNKEVKGE